MDQTPVSPARRLAFDALFRVYARDENSDAAQDDLLRRRRPSPPDRALASELLYGTLRWQALLDHFLGQLADRPLAKIERRALLALRLGAYQLLCLERIPPSAAVNESVQLAPKPARGFVNAILRGLGRRREQLRQPAQIPDPIARLATAQSHPEWLARRFVDDLGAEEAERLLIANNTRPPLTLRANLLRTTRDQLLDLLARAGVAAAAGKYSPLAVTLAEAGPVRELPGYDEGRFAVQDEASQLAALAVGAGPGEWVLDCCAAPGTKTNALAGLMGNEGRILAVDVSAERLARLAAEAERLGSRNITPLVADAGTDFALPAGFSGRLFDRVLVDAPCTGLGTIRRRPEIKWRRTPADPAAMAARQRAILLAASRRVRPGGTLVYSTCSLLREENEEVVAALPEGFTRLDPAEFSLPAARELVRDGLLRTWPQRTGMDGFSIVRLRRE